MYSIRYSHQTQDFKIKSKQDVYTFLEEMYRGSTFVMIDKGHCLFITVRDNDGALIRVSEKFGDLADPFNLEFELDEQRAIDTLYKYRKLINARMLAD